MGAEAVQIAWALVGSRVAHISDFAGIPAGSRPEARCEWCKGQLVMRLGHVRAHHFGHKPDALCALTNPRFAERYNAARRIIALLGRADSLCISERCKGRFSKPCASERRSTFAANWDDIVLQKTSGETGPAVQFVRNDEAFATLVLARSRATTDATDNHSARAWIVADDVVRWNAKNPLPAFQVAGRPLFQCERCSEIWNSRGAGSGTQSVVGPVKATKPLDVSRDRVDQRVGSSRISTSLPRVHRERVVDIYPSQGALRRHTFMMVLNRPRDGVLRLYLHREGVKRFIASVRVDGTLEAAERKLHEAFSQYVKEMCKAEAAFFDSPIGWAAVDTVSPVRFTPRFDRAGDGTWRKIAN